MSLRLGRHQDSALKIAKWFEEREEVEQVLHPALPSCPGHEIWKRDFTGSSGLFSVVLKPHYSKESVEKFIDSLQYFGIGFSWGGFESPPFHLTRVKIVRNITGRTKGTPSVYKSA